MEDPDLYLDLLQAALLPLSSVGRHTDGCQGCKLGYTMAGLAFRISTETESHDGLLELILPEDASASHLVIIFAASHCLQMEIMI